MPSYYSGIIVGALLMLAVFVIIIIPVVKSEEKKYWKKILANQRVPMYWDAAPKCPYCGQINEAAFGLEEDGEWHTTYCFVCDKTFWIKPRFELTSEVTKDNGTT